MRALDANMQTNTSHRKQHACHHSLLLALESFTLTRAREANVQTNTLRQGSGRRCFTLLTDDEYEHEDEETAQKIIRKR